MKRRSWILLVLCVTSALMLSFCCVRCFADPAEDAPSATASPPTGGMAGMFPYLLGTGVLLGLFVAIRLRRKAEHDPARNKRG